ncbi:MAG: hypothetical protein IKD76_08500 [Clostridia bacterium]|nr:hypothetical protein [Clostridia bacterium]
MVDLSEYKDAVEYIKRYFVKDLEKLEITSVIMYGSATYEKGFVKGISDLDICAFTNKMYTTNYEDIVNYIIRNTTENFIDKKPSIVVDRIADRIEFYIHHTQISIDVTIMAPELPNVENSKQTAIHDSLEILLGAFYQHGVPIIGEIPQKKFVEDNFLPFYGDELREARLNILIPRIKKYNARIENCIEERNYDILDYIYKSRGYFLKWLFIYNRKYPVNLQKHLDYQLSTILLLPQEEKQKLLFTGDENLFKLASDYLQLVNSYLNEYEKI